MDTGDAQNASKRVHDNNIAINQVYVTPTFVGCRVECYANSQAKVQVYLYDESDPDGPPRNHAETCANSKEATRLGQDINV